MKEYLKIGAFLAGFVLLQSAWTWANPAMPPFRMQAFALTEKQIQEEIAAEEARKVLSGQSCPADVPLLAAKASLKNGISVRVVAADIRVESSCNPRAVSKAGAVGLMQINRHIWKTGKNLFNHEANIELGTKILAENTHRYGLRNGLRRYFGVTEGSDASDKYAAKVLLVARHGG